MSKRLGAQIQCGACGHKFNVSLYRSIWIEEPANRDLIFSDQINRFNCPSCRNHIDTEFAFLATNVKRQIAIWFEPQHDPNIDKDIAGYKKMMGSNSFYAKAPRISDWEEFKRTILEYERKSGGTGDPGKPSKELSKSMSDFIRKLGKK